MHLFLKSTHSSWTGILTQALTKVDTSYQEDLIKDPNWLPGSHNLFKAFSIPREKIRYLLLGESPYPRASSANGYAFWDNAVDSLWSSTGFSKPVNRATSLRNWIKMLLVARGDLSESDVSQSAIAGLDKIIYTQTAADLFGNFLDQGFLLLNAALVFRSAETVKEEAKAWFPFLEALLIALKEEGLELILLGSIAKKINKISAINSFKILSVEHPYNISFIHNKCVQDFFRPFDLLRKT